MMLVEARSGMRGGCRGIGSCNEVVWSFGLSGLRCRCYDDVRVVELVFVFGDLLKCEGVCRMSSRC